MSAPEKTSAAAPAQAEAQEKSLVDKMLENWAPEERNRGKELVKTFVEEALKGVVTFDKNVAKTIKSAIDALDADLSKQLAAILHHPDLQKLEGTWRGLHYLVFFRASPDK